MILHDQDNNVFVAGDNLQDYIISKAGGRDMQQAIQALFNDRSTSDYLNKRIFNKQKFDFSRRKVLFRQNNLNGEYSSKKIHLIHLNEKLKKELAGTYIPIDTGLSIQKDGETNYYNQYKPSSNKTSNVCQLTS